jgi:hypothetical protein
MNHAHKNSLLDHPEPGSRIPQLRPSCQQHTRYPKSPLRLRFSHELIVMVQAISCWPITAEYRLRARVGKCWICDGQSGNGTGFSSISSAVSCQHHSTVTLHIHISPGNEQQACLWPQFRDIVSLHGQEQLQHFVISSKGL